MWERRGPYFFFPQLNLVSNLCLNPLFCILFHVILLIPSGLVFIAATFVSLILLANQYVFDVNIIKDLLSYGNFAESF